MHPNEILPAIPRQKIKNTNDEKYAVIIGEAIKLVDSELLVDTPLGLRWWRIEDCEPVHNEEPRPFRVGDKVVALDYAQNPQAYFKIQTLEKKDGKDYAHGSIFGYPLEHIRHATPSEVAQYFNKRT